MTDFKAGGIPVPDYEQDEVTFFNGKTEFTDDVFVYGKLYAELGGDVQTFSTGNVERMRITKEGDIIFSSNNVSISGVTTVATLNVNGNTNLSGITTGTFVGNGSGLTGVIGVGQGIEIQDDASVVGTAGTVNFDTNLDVVSFSGGTVTVRGSQNFAGVVTATTFKGALQGTSGTFSSGVDITGDLDVDGHTDLDNVNIVGVTTIGVNNFTAYTPFNGNWATSSAINLVGNYGGGLAFNDNGNDGYVQYVDGNGANFHLKNGSVGGVTKQSIRCVKDNDVELYFNGNEKLSTTNDGVRIYGGLQDKDGQLGNSGQVLSSTGSQLNWIDISSGGNVAQARKVSDSSTSTQFNPVGFVDKLTLTVSNVQSTSNILLFFRFTLGHNGSGNTGGRVTGPSLFGGDTQFTQSAGSQTFSGVLFDASSSTTREFKIQYSDNGGVSSTISNAELFATEIKVS